MFIQLRLQVLIINSSVVPWFSSLWSVSSHVVNLHWISCWLRSQITMVSGLQSLSSIFLDFSAIGNSHCLIFSGFLIRSSCKGGLPIGCGSFCLLDNNCPRSRIKCLILKIPKDGWANWLMIHKSQSVSSDILPNLTWSISSLGSVLLHWSFIDPDSSPLYHQGRSAFVISADNPVMAN